MRYRFPYFGADLKSIKSNLLVDIKIYIKIIICQQDTKAGKPALTDALETVRQKLGKIDNATS